MYLYDNGLTSTFWGLCVLWWLFFLGSSFFEVAFGTFSPSRLGDRPWWRERRSLLERYLDKTERMRLLCVGAVLASTVAFSVVVSFGVSEMADTLAVGGERPPVLVGVFFVTLLLLMVGRVFGRAVGVRFNEGIVSGSVRLLYPISIVCEPLLRLRAAFDHLLAAKDTSVGDELADEIRSAVENGESEEPLEDVHREMIQSIVEFRDVEVREIMTPRTEVAGIEIGTPLSEARQIVVDEGHTRLPVYENDLDNVVGILNAKDLIGRIGRPGWESVHLKDIMRKARYIPETKKIDELFEELRAQKTHMAIVLDEYGGTAGVVTIEDILEEIVGEIEDEYDAETREAVEHIDADTIEVDARMRVGELNDILPLDIPEDDDFDTVGGFVFSHLGRIPRVGERFDYGGVEITVLDGSERCINRLRLSKRKGGGSA
ncbi:MAG: HlyC/CorC family transporter [Planctomycetes bacterium]|nr:HlyC/CorC family transporter [Planctomycetota bacterium]